jgi:protein-S-isoprenylcysteine O-methyltransferase Ste14
LDRHSRWVGLLVFGVGFWLKAVREEAFLEAEFGDDYRKYRGETGMLMPRIHRRQAQPRKTVSSRSP